MFPWKDPRGQQGRNYTMETRQTLTDLLAAAFTGTQKFFEGPFTPREDLPPGCIEGPIPESMQPVVRLYGWTSKELTELHNSMDESDSPATEEVERRHEELHAMLNVLEKIIQINMSMMDRPEGVSTAGTIVSVDTFAWCPLSTEEDSGPSFFMKDLLTEVFGADVVVMALGRGARSSQ